MKTIVIQANQCPSCGKALAGGALAGLCPACLLAQGGEDNGPTPHRFVPPTLEEVKALFPQLEVVSLIGAGGMGAVYKARQPALDRWVALKILPADKSGGINFPERFNREARALARLSHPNIVAVHEFGQARDLHYFIMEFVDGANLRQLEQAGRLSPREALQIIPQICDALQYAHDEGVVHRDIKPENVLVDRKGRVKIADFGLAKILGQETDGHRLTIEGQVMGTPHYMAPEQVEQPLTVDHRADIYALGVVFYEMLTGDLPLGKFPPPSRKVQVDVRLDDVVLRALENDPERRYQKASEVKSQVETIAATEAPSNPTEPAARPGTQFLHWAGFRLALQRGEKRRVHWKGVLLGWALLFGLITIPFAFVTAVTGRSLMGWIGTQGWPGVIVRAVLALLFVAYGTRRALSQPLGPGGTALLPRIPWWRRRAVVISSLVLLAATWAVFQERWPGIQLNLRRDPFAFRAAQTASLDSRTGRLIARLPGRGTAEILAIGETNANPADWWTPNGAIIEEADFEVPAPVENQMSGFVSKDILIRVRDLPGDASSLGVRAGPESGVGSGGTVLRNGKPLAGAYQARITAKPSARKQTLHIGFGLEPWKTIATISADGHQQNHTRGAGDPNWEVRFHHEPSDTTSGAEIAIVFGPESPMWQHQVVAVDQNGAKHSATSARGTPIEKLTLWTCTFRGRALGSLKEFQVQVRPVHWVEFPDVALTPATPLPQSAPRQFAPVVERSFDAIIDFDTGNTRPFPIASSAGETPSLSSLADNAVWMARNGFDAAAGRGELQPLDMDFVLLSDDEWETLRPVELLKRIYGNYYHPRVVKPESRSRTFGFRTREHGTGLIQFTEQTPGAAGVSLRYKLVQKPARASQRENNGGDGNAPTSQTP